MPEPKKATKKTPAKRAPDRRRQIEHPTDEEKWNIWQARLLSMAVSLICIIGIVNELFVEPKPREQALLFLGSVLGLPAVVSGAKKIVSGGS